MSANIQYEMELLSVSVLTGAGLMIVYDCLRVFRILCPHRAAWVGIEDMLYWIYTSVMVFTLLYREQDGVVRSYVVAAVFVGMVVYQQLISKNFLNSLKKWVEYLRMKLSRKNRKKMKS